MSKIPGYVFIVIGFAGIIFFFIYSGTEIPSKELWLVFSFFFVIIGGFLLAKQKFESMRNKFNRTDSSSDDNPSPSNEHRNK